MAASTVADFVLRRLRGWGVDTVFGYPGDGINGLLAACRSSSTPHRPTRSRWCPPAWASAGPSSHRPVIVFAGDGAMQQWPDPRLIIAVLHNDDLNQVTWEMRAMAGAPKFTESQTLPDVDYAGFAASLGLQGIALDKPGDIAPAWDNALSAKTPTLLDVRCDPNVPPIPPHATIDQMTSTAKAMLAGDEDRWGVLKQGMKTKLQEFLPHHSTQ